MRGKKVNVIDIIEENSKTKQNECVSYEKRKKKVERKKNIIVLVLLTRVYQSMNFFFFHFIKSSNIHAKIE